MNPIWKSLFWKEWQEQKWKLVALTAAMIVVLLISIFGGDVTRSHRHADEYFIGTILRGSAISLIGYAVLAGMFVGMSLAGKENSRRTMQFLQSLPLPLWQAAAAKLSMALVVVSIPVLVHLAGVWIVVNYTGDPLALAEAIRVHFLQMGQPWGIENWFASRSFSGILGTASLLLWMAAAGVNRSDEVRAGALGFLVIAGLWLVFASAVEFTGRYGLHVVQEIVVMSLSPALPGAVGLVSQSNAEQSFLSMRQLAFVGLVSHVAALTWYLSRFGKVAVNPGRGSSKETTLFCWQGNPSAPWRTQLGAIAWKQFRETGPLALFAVVAVLGTTFVVYFISFDSLENSLAGVALSFGALVTLVSGMGVLIEDQKPKVNNFWRSRPFNLGLWFWVKYLAGLAVLVLTFGPLLILAIWWSNWAVNFEGSWLLGLFLVLIYSMSLATFAYLRQPVYSAVLTLFLLYFGTITVESVAYRLRLHDTVAYPITAILIALALTVSLAYLAVKHDWGWKR